MSWNETDRVKYAVIRERYATDLSDAEFALIAPLLPPAKPVGRKPTDARIIIDALFYLIRSGCSRNVSRRSRPCKIAFTLGATVGYGSRLCVFW
jgi:hypothetical protein